MTASSAIVMVLEMTTRPVPDLQVLRRSAAADPRRPPLLFVHGGCFGAWCWDEHFLRYFASAGFDCAAVSLRGHGTSSNAGRLQTVTLGDYVRDVLQVVRTLPETPVLIGHSLGGTVIQHLAQTVDVPGLVLLASNPPTGSATTAVGAFRRHPWRAVTAAITGRQLRLFGTAELAREWFFTSDTSEATVVSTVARLQEESAVAVVQSIGRVRRPRSRKVIAPVLVVGAGRDTMISPGQVRVTAEYYNTQAHMVPESGHCIMLDTHWRDAAEMIASWLTDRFESKI
jgi:pimeloyl-ACP methyl ester carboxylesterase